MFESSLGLRMRKAKSILREFKFSIMDDCGRYDKALSGESVLVQGVIDCALIEDDGIVLIDFKTDQITKDDLQKVADRYASQVRVYADAIARIYQMPVKQKILYLFSLDTSVEIV